MRVKRGGWPHRYKKYLTAAKRAFVVDGVVLYRTAVKLCGTLNAVFYVGRKLRKRDFRSLWIMRINAGARINGLSYSRFMYGLKRPVLSSTARSWRIWPSIRKMTAKVVDMAKAALA